MGGTFENARIVAQMQAWGWSQQTLDAIEEAANQKKTDYNHGEVCPNCGTNAGVHVKTVFRCAREFQEVKYPKGTTRIEIGPDDPKLIQITAIAAKKRAQKKAADKKTEDDDWPEKAPRSASSNNAARAVFSIFFVVLLGVVALVVFLFAAGPGLLKGFQGAISGGSSTTSSSSTSSTSSQTTSSSTPAGPSGLKVYHSDTATCSDTVVTADITADGTVELKVESSGALLTVQPYNGPGKTTTLSFNFSNVYVDVDKHGHVHDIRC